jgi:hypothetical protein
MQAEFSAHSTQVPPMVTETRWFVSSMNRAARLLNPVRAGAEVRWNN